MDRPGDESQHDAEPDRRAEAAARSSEWAVVTTIGLLLACWTLLVL